MTVRWICSLGHDPITGREWGLGAELRVVAGVARWVPFVSTTEAIESGPMRCDVTLAIGWMPPMTLRAWRDSIGEAKRTLEDIERANIAETAQRWIERALALRPSLEEVDRAA